MAGRKKELYYNNTIAAKIKELIRNKVKIEYILSYLAENYENAPLNDSQLRKVYGDTIRAARAEAISEIGEKVFNQAKDGHFPSQEFYLKTQEDWSTKDKIAVGLDTEGDNSAIGTILTMLGKEPK